MKRTFRCIPFEKERWDYASLRPSLPLENAHAELDAAMLEAYGWPTDISNEQILEELLELNLSRTA